MTEIPQPEFEDPELERARLISQLMEKFALLGSNKNVGSKPVGIFNSSREFPVDDASSFVCSHSLLSGQEPFGDHNYANPTNQVQARLKSESGSTLILCTRDAYSDNPAQDVIAVDQPSREVKRSITRATAGSVFEKAVNHLTTSGAFITEVEDARRQRLESKILEIQLEADEARPATIEEIQRMIDAVESLLAETAAETE